MFASFTYVESDVVALHVVRDTWDLRTDHLKEPSPIGRCKETGESIWHPSKVGTTSLRSEHAQLVTNTESSLWKDFDLQEKLSIAMKINLDKVVYLD